MKLPSARSYASVLALFRISVGLFWLAHGVGKFTNAPMFMPPTGLITTYIANAIGNSLGFYHDFLLNVVQPNISIFAELVRVGEVVAGALLVLGLLTRLGGLIGVVLATNYLFANHEVGSFSGWSSIDGVAVLISAVNLVLPTGRVLGLDWLLGRAAKPRVAPAATIVRPEPVTAEFVEEAPLEGPSAPRE